MSDDPNTSFPRTIIEFKEKDVDAISRADYLNWLVLPMRVKPAVEFRTINEDNPRNPK